MRLLWIVALMMSFSLVSGCAAIKGAREDKAEARANALKAAKNPVKKTVDVDTGSSSNAPDNFNQPNAASKAAERAGKMLSPIVQ
jgi:hypothetical protein